jgi:hypothetical protein
VLRGAGASGSSPTWLVGGSGTGVQAQTVNTQNKKIKASRRNFFMAHLRLINGDRNFSFTNIIIDKNKKVNPKIFHAAYTVLFN